jgi:hypothetical protein
LFWLRPGSGCSAVNADIAGRWKSLLSLVLALTRTRYSQF